MSDTLWKDAADAYARSVVIPIRALQADYEPTAYERGMLARVRDAYLAGAVASDEAVKAATADRDRVLSELAHPEHFSESEVVRALTARAEGAERDWQAAEATIAELLDERNGCMRTAEEQAALYTAALTRAVKAEASLRDLQEGIRALERFQIVGQYGGTIKWTGHPNGPWVLWEDLDQLLTRLGSPAGAERVGQQEEKETKT